MRSLTNEPMSSKRQSIFLSGLDNTVPPADLSVREPGTEVASNSQVDDLGNGKHLEQQNDPEYLAAGPAALPQLPTDNLLVTTGTGLGFRLEEDCQSMSGDLDALSESQPSPSGYDNGLPGEALPATQDRELADLTGGLGDELREACCNTAGKQQREFVPIDALDRIVTEDRVRDILRNFSKGSSSDPDQDVQQILGTSAIPGKTTSRKKIFAILALIDKLEAIWDFVAEDIYDFHLPFEKQRAQIIDGARKSHFELSRRSDTCASARIPIRSSQGWSGAAVAGFEKTQWEVHVPIFFLNTDKEPKVRHYRLQESVILPFIEDDEVEHCSGVGGFGDVWRVKLHPSHHNQGTLTPGKDENPSFAIKRLRYMDESAFRKEVENLKRFSQRDYLHLIKLLGTYEWRRQYYLIFPLADGNLLDFWQAHSEPPALAHDRSTVLWFSEQCLGLVEGMTMIHTCDTPEASGQGLLPSVPAYKSHGCHGDLKPQNILWFKQRSDIEKQQSSLGHFKICDFGMSHFHETKSMANIETKDIGFSPTYQAPEMDVKDRLTQSYDVWSLGCVLLEFATWYLGGSEELMSFRRRRINEDRQYDNDYKFDRFFNFTRPPHGEPDETRGKAQICAVGKPSVVWQYKRLYEDPHCSDYLLDFLELIQQGLLRLGPEKRKCCAEITESLKRLHANLQEDPGYGIDRIKSPPSRTPTLDSVLIDGEISPAMKRQILKSIPRTLSFDRETACNSTSISVALSSSPSSSLMNLVSGTGRDSRPSSPERKAAFRLSIDMTTVEEGLATQVEAATEQQPHPDVGTAASGDTAKTDEGHSQSTENVARLNIMCDEESLPISSTKQHLHASGTGEGQQTSMVENTAAEVLHAELGPEAGFNQNNVSAENSPAKLRSSTTVEKRPKRDGDGASQPAMDGATTPGADSVSESSLSTGDTNGGHDNSSRGVPQRTDILEHLEVPQDGWNGNSSSESPNLFHKTSDAGQEDVLGRRTRNSSQTGSQGREKMSRHTDIEESDIEAERTESGWFKSSLKKLLCFFQLA